MVYEYITKRIDLPAKLCKELVLASRCHRLAVVGCIGHFRLILIASVNFSRTGKDPLYEAADADHASNASASLLLTTFSPNSGINRVLVLNGAFLLRIR